MLGRGGGGQMMLPASMYSASAPNSLLGRYLSNTPEEDDETMSTVERHTAIAAAVQRPDSPLRPSMAREHKPLPLPPHDLSFTYRPPCSLPAGYGQPTPYPSRAQGAWPHPSFASSWSGYPNSLPSCPSLKDPHLGCSGDGGPPPGYKFYSLPGGGGGGGGGGESCMGSLEQPLSLHSNPPTRHHTMSPYTCPPQGAACCAQCPPEPFKAPAWPQYHPAYGQYYPGECRLPETGFTRMGRNVLMPEKQAPHSAPLPVEQRRVFVTYEADNDKHVNEIINFVALLRHNGFDTHIDIFEQQFRSISKIDFMERYLSEKEYLIIIIISPKYYETVTAPPLGLENDERTQNTVYIHKQLQNEFIQNGSKNFRFIPILFPGAKKCHVPNWLQNTHVYGWPRDRDDILRRLMRVEKYNPPPIGELPTIVSIPI